MIINILHFGVKLRSVTIAWLRYALLSALFAALPAVFAKLGVEGVNSNLATAIRTVVILVIAWALVLLRGEAAGIGVLSYRTLVFLVVRRGDGRVVVVLFPGAAAWQRVASSTG